MKHHLWFLICVCLLAATPTAQARNPICPPGLNIADPTARVWKDGRLYVYGSRDNNLKSYCSHDHWVLSTADLVNWTYTPDVFASQGPGDKVSYSDSRLYAPDCVYRDGTYYLYYCQPGKIREGVATAASPTGPFSEGKPMNVGQYDEIDPAVFIDDDGQAYYLWGQFNAKMAKLRPNMTELDPETINASVLTVKEHEFHEGSFLTKRNGIYYFVYASTEREKRPTTLSYATSDSPMGPYKHRGVIIDNKGCDPAVWNNHGSIVEFNGRWYVFYHRSTHSTRMGRKACIEPITFLPDGSIPEVEMTSQGAGKPLDAFASIEAELACKLGGNLRITYLALDTNNLVSGGNNDQLAEIKSGDWAAYKYVDFGQGARSVSLKVRPVKEASKVELRLDSPSSRPVAALEIPAGGEAPNWITCSGYVADVSGVHALYLTFILPDGAESHLAVDSFRFE